MRRSGLWAGGVGAMTCDTAVAPAPGVSVIPISQTPAAIAGEIRCAADGSAEACRASTHWGHGVWWLAGDLEEWHGGGAAAQWLPAQSPAHGSFVVISASANQTVTLACIPLANRIPRREGGLNFRHENLIETPFPYSN